MVLSKVLEGQRDVIQNVFLAASGGSMTKYEAPSTEIREAFRSPGKSWQGPGLRIKASQMGTGWTTCNSESNTTSRNLRGGC